MLHPPEGPRPLARERRASALLGYLYAAAMQQPVKERIAKLREEIAQISEAKRLYLQNGKNKLGAVGDHAVAFNGCRKS